MEKTKNRIIIENPPKKVLDFVMKVQKENESVVRHQYSGGRQGGCLPFFFISLILRSQEPLVELLRKEVQNNFETITGQK